MSKLDSVETLVMDKVAQLVLDSHPIPRLRLSQLQFSRAKRIRRSRDN